MIASAVKQFSLCNGIQFIWLEKSLMLEDQTMDHILQRCPTHRVLRQTEWSIATHTCQALWRERWTGKESLFWPIDWTTGVNCERKEEIYVVQISSFNIVPMKKAFIIKFSIFNSLTQDKESILFTHKIWFLKINLSPYLYGPNAQVALCFKVHVEYCF